MYQHYHLNIIANRDMWEQRRSRQNEKGVINDLNDLCQNSWHDNFKGEVEFWEWSGNVLIHPSTYL